MGKRDLIALLNLSSWYVVIVVWLFLAVSWVCLQSVIVVFPDHTHLLFSMAVNCIFLIIPVLRCFVLSSYIFVSLSGTVESFGPYFSTKSFGSIVHT